MTAKPELVPAPVIARSAGAGLAKPVQAPARDLPVPAPPRRPMQLFGIRLRVRQREVTNHFRSCRNRQVLRGKRGTMPRGLTGVRSAAAVAAIVLLSSAASAQMFRQPQSQTERPAPRPAAPGRRGDSAADCACCHRRPAQWGCVSQRHVVRPFPGRPETARGGGRRIAADACRRCALPRLRPGHRQPRPRPARVRADLYPVRRAHGGAVPDAAGPGAHQDLRRRRFRARRRSMACRPP